MTSLETVYTLAVQLPRSTQRDRVLDEMVREYRWKRYVREHREFEQGAEAGRRLAR